MLTRLRLQRRATARLRLWPQAIVDDVLEYFRSSEARLAGQTDRRDPYWLELPRWLTRSARFRRTRRVDSRFLSDVTWGQYCLFLHGRIRDDLFDGETSIPALAYLGDELLIEAERTFARHFPSGPFGPLLRTLVDTSVHGVLEVDALQRNAGGTRREYLTAYARMAAMFKAGSAAMCVKCGLMRDFPRLSSFVDEMATASQIVDDIIDLQQDLSRGRFNFAASRLMADAQNGARDPISQIGRDIVFEDALGSVVEEARRHADRAAAAIRPLGIAEAGAFLDAFRRGLESLTSAVHQARVTCVFGPHSDP